jgi:PIN domain nuclease of toxin-antitoxin system
LNLLLDTHVLLWWLGDHPTLGRRARRLSAGGQP